MIRKGMQYFMVREMRKTKIWVKKPGEVRRLSRRKRG